MAILIYIYIQTLTWSVLLLLFIVILSTTLNRLTRKPSSVKQQLKKMPYRIQSAHNIPYIRSAHLYFPLSCRVQFPLQLQRDIDARCHHAGRTDRWSLNRWTDQTEQDAASDRNTCNRGRSTRGGGADRIQLFLVTTIWTPITSNIWQIWI